MQEWERRLELMAKAGSIPNYDTTHDFIRVVLGEQKLLILQILQEFAQSNPKSSEIVTQIQRKIEGQ